MDRFPGLSLDKGTPLATSDSRLSRQSRGKSAAESKEMLSKMNVPCMPSDYIFEVTPGCYFVFSSRL